MAAYVRNKLYIKFNKSSAVAETSDYARAKWAAVTLLWTVSLLWTELGPHLTLCRLSRGLPPYPVVSWSIQPFGHNRHGPKMRGCVSLSMAGELGTYLTQCRLGQGLPLYLMYQVASGSIQPFGHNRYRPRFIWTQARLACIRKLQKWGLLCPFL